MEATQLLYHSNLMTICFIYGSSFPSIFNSQLIEPPTPAMFSYLISFLSFARVISAVCYDINGTLVTTADYVPCNSISGTISMCCALNRGSSSPFTPDTCLPNGLCQNVFTNQTTNKPDTNYWREYCSDPGWNSQYCLPAACTTPSVSTVFHCSQGSRTQAF